MQHTLFEIEENKKTYRAIRHDVIRKRQSEYCDTAHHPNEKINQIRKVLSEICGWGDLSILELFAGQGNCTRIYSEYGEVMANEYKAKVYEQLKENVKDCEMVHCNRVNSFLDFHQLIALKLTFDVIDLDPYGFPNRMFPDIFLLIDDGVMFVTMPKPYVNILNGITQAHLISYYGEQNPSKETIIDRIALWGLCHWRKVELIDCVDCKSVWRFAFKVEKVKATEYTGVNNR
tara:strand:+ start:667 stop:1362 length:696 start_codon:yes stop_codon:yes gene_type:complete